MMNRITYAMIEFALLLSAANALIAIVRMAISEFLPISWFWGGSIAAFAGPVLLAGALHLLSSIPLTTRASD